MYALWPHLLFFSELIDGEPERAPHWSVINASIVQALHVQKFTLKHGKLHTVWSSYRTSVSCTKIYEKKVESPTPGYLWCHV